MSLLSNFSYTNKDFNSIYSELLDLVDKISPSWKPGSTDGSNEADPGVLLLKLDALMADKNSYNIDKSILELFPDSVTQYPNARELYEQCGYVMPYYRAAEAYITLTLRKEPEINVEELKGDTKTRYYCFPPFMEVCTKDTTTKFVIVQPNVILDTVRKSEDFRALQGSHHTYRINDSYIITAKDLDYNNRLYFKESNVAENGIFIHWVNDGNVNYTCSLKTNAFVVLLVIFPKNLQ